MTVDASCRLLLVCSFLVPGRKVCFGELFHGLSCAALDIFLSRYPLSLKGSSCGNLFPMRGCFLVQTKL